MADDVRRRIPRTDAVLSDPRLQRATASLGGATVKRIVTSAQERARRGDIAADDVVEAAVAALPRRASGLRPVINATGVVLHTNLGRAPLSPAAVEALVAASGYVDVEYDVATGARARRGRTALDALCAAVPAAGDVHVVNNGAAALVLAATALAQGREIVVSRGEMVEIGDGFRLPDLVASTGARLVEVGTTNRTTYDDYRRAIDANTGFVLKVHPSNFVVRGFTGAVPVAELASLGPPVVVDIGSGLLHPHPLLPDEPDATSALTGGAALVTASGDKLLGGPQAGLLLGDAELVGRLRTHPLARALRVDKLTLAALEATLTGPPPPALASLAADAESLRSRAEAIARALRAAGVDADVVGSAGCVGGGGAPEVGLPGWAVALDAALAESLRRGDPAVVGRVERGRLLLDLRCVAPGDDGVLLDVVRTAACK
ncbi:MAG: L-seryl-tRNA(Sec) selenium transferase [Frankiaceae bacterium]|nr:L-seryl-tRNA(Sec) selenium transferase [Frankiaceae bacterium]